MLTDHGTSENPDKVTLPEPLVSETDPSGTQSEAHACKDCKYATVIYVTGHRSFWLVPQGVLDQLETSAERLKTAATQETLEARLAGLQKAGLTDLFLPAAAESFLLPADQSEWQRLQSENQAARRELKQLGEKLVSAEKASFLEISALGSGEDYYRNRLPLINRWRTERDQLKNQKSLIRNSVNQRLCQIEELREAGFAAANEAGYEVINGELFSPEQKSINKMLRNYLKARYEFEKTEFSNETKTALFVNTVRNNRTLIEYEWTQKTPDTKQVEQYLAELTSLEDKMREYVYTVLDLANIGIATPEYALVNGNRNTEDGVLKLARFKQLQWQIDTLIEDMKKHGRAWFGLLGGNGPVPAPALLKYQTRIQDCQSQQQELRKTAQENSEAMLPPTLFVWNPDDYKSSPHQALVRPGIPLREFSMPRGDSTLQHFSLFDIGGGKEFFGEPKQPDTHFDLAMSIKAAQRPNNDEALDKLLNDLGAKKYPVENNWFDRSGLFQPEIFYQAIEHEGVLEHQSPEELGIWGACLRTLLFESEAKRHLMSFDESYTGQLTRLILNGIPGELGDTLENELKVEILSGTTGRDQRVDFEKKDGQQKIGYKIVDAKVGANLTYRQGQIDLLSLTFPKPEEAQPITVPYLTEDGHGELDLGRFYCELDVKCWGFVGASLLLSRSIGVEAAPGKGIQIIGLDHNKRQATGAEFNAFAGAQSGLLARAEMKWAIPDRLRQSQKWRLMREDVPEWISLGLVSGELVGALGVGAQGDIKIGLNNGRLVFYVKGRAIKGLGGGFFVGFELAFDTLPLWIRLLQQELHDNGYRRIAWIDDDAFNLLSMLTNLRLSVALSISFLAAQGYDFVEEVYRDFNSGKNAGIVSASITEAIEIADGTRIVTDNRPRVSLEEYKSWFLGLQPEAIGPMLHNLVSEPVKYEGTNGEEPRSAEQMLKLQQRSIFQCLQWMNESEMVQPEPYSRTKPNRIQRQFEESVTRMNAQGTKPQGTRLVEARKNISRLDEFMGRDDLLTQIDSDRSQAYRSLRKKFSLHLWEQV